MKLGSAQTVIIENIPIVTKADSYDYVTCFKKRNVKRVPEPKYSSPYKAWLFRNCDNRNTPELKKEDPHDYVTRFKKHNVKRAPCKCDKNYAAWFERNCVSKSTGVMPAPFLNYQQWFTKHCITSIPIKLYSAENEPYKNGLKDTQNKKII